jgi:hypothetical protein
MRSLESRVSRLEQQADKRGPCPKCEGWCQLVIVHSPPRPDDPPLPPAWPCPDCGYAPKPPFGIRFIEVVVPDPHGRDRHAT